MAYSFILTAHIVAGVVGVLLGPPALIGIRPRLTRRVFTGAVLAVCVSAVGLALLDLAALWWFVPIAAGSYLFAWRGQRADRRGDRVGVLRGHGGAYIALWSAIVVVSVPDAPLVWLLPTLLGVPVLEWLAHRARPAAQPTGALP